MVLRDCQDPLVLLGYPVHLDLQEERVTVVTSVFQDQLEKRALRVNQDRWGHQDRLAWQGFQVQWDQWDHQGPPDHLGHHIALAMVIKMDMRYSVVCLDSEANLDPRAHLVLQVILEIQVYQEHLVAKEQKDHEDLLGSLAWMVQLEKKVQRETAARKERGVCQEEMVDHLDLQALLDLQDRSSTSQEEMLDQVFQAGQDSQAQWDQKGKKGTKGHQDMHLREKKESLVSSRGLMGDLYSWEA